MLIKNFTLMSYEAVLEFNRAFLKKRKRSWIIYGVATLFVLFVLLTDIITMPLTGKAPSMVLVLCAVLILTIDIYFIFVYTVLLKKNIKKNPLLNSRVEYEFYDEFFVDITASESLSNRVEVKYSLIKSVEESENFIYICLDRVVGAHVIDKNGFTVGNEEMLKDFLREKLDAKKIKFK